MLFSHTVCSCYMVHFVTSSIINHNKNNKNMFVCVCVLVWKWISSVISQFEKSPATAQISFLACRLEYRCTKSDVCLLSVQYASLCVITFRMKVTPSSKRMPRSGDAELQRRKQSPSNRVGRIPDILNTPTHTHRISDSHQA